MFTVTIFHVIFDLFLTSRHISSRAPVAVVRGADGGRKRSQSIKHWLVEWLHIKEMKIYQRDSRRVGLEPLLHLSSQSVPVTNAIAKNTHTLFIPPISFPCRS